MAVPWLWRLSRLARHCGGLESDPRPARVGFVMEKVALGQVCLGVLLFSPVIIIPPMARTFRTSTTAAIFS
jgi:hypothetical protein